MWQNVSGATTRTAIRRLSAIYLLVSAPALLFPYHPKSWMLLFAFHLTAALFLLRPEPLRRFSETRFGRGVADWYLILLIPAFYTELAPLNFSIFHGKYFDSHIIAAEQRIFGGMPSHDFAKAYPYLPLSEFFHFAYLSYYLIIFMPPLYLYLKGLKDQQQRMIFNLLLAFFAHYVFFIYFPVQGPRYLFPPPGGELANGFFYQLAHKALEAGSSQGAAFPSSHVGVSFAQAAFTILGAPLLAPIIFVLSVGLTLGAVYGGFHYGTDALVGLIYGLILFFIAPRLAQKLGK